MNLPAISCALGLLILGGCAYHPPSRELPEYGRSEKTWAEVEADSIYKYDRKKLKWADSSEKDVSNYIREGFDKIAERSYTFAVEPFNKAWLLDSLNPHIYMGFALAEMWEGETKNAVRYYAKYRELYEKNPVPRFPAKSDSAASPDSAKAATPDTSWRESFVYGKLVLMKKDWGIRFEPEWCDVSLSSANAKHQDRMLNSDVLPENERIILYRYFFARYNPADYVEAEIKVLKIYDKTSGKWVAPPKDSVYRLSYVEREGLFVSEEERKIVELGAPSVPDSSARVFLLKPYAYKDDPLAPFGYTDGLSEQDLGGSPDKLKLNLYQTRKFIEPSPIKTPVRSGIAHALTDGKYDSLRIYLDLARELEKHYGYMPLSDAEYAHVSLLDSGFLADSTVYRYEKKLRDGATDNSVNDSLELLIAYRLYPYVFSDEFFDRVSSSPEKIRLINMAQQPFINSAGKIPDNRVGFRVHIGPRVNVYDGSIRKVIGPASVGGEMDVEGCLLYGCLGMGVSIYGQVDGKETIKYDGEVYDRSLTGDASLMATLGIRPFIHRHGDLELYGVVNVAEYATKDSTFKTLSSVDLGVGAAITYLFFDSEKGVKSSFIKDVRIKSEYILNDSQRMLGGEHGYTLALSLQFGFGMASYTFIEEKDNKHEFGIWERVNRFRANYRR